MRHPSFGQVPQHTPKTKAGSSRAISVTMTAHPKYTATQLAFIPCSLAYLNIGSVRKAESEVSAQVFESQLILHHTPFCEISPYVLKNFINEVWPHRVRLEDAHTISSFAACGLVSCDPLLAKREALLFVLGIRAACACSGIPILHSRSVTASCNIRRIPNRHAKESYVPCPYQKVKHVLFGCGRKKQY